MNTNRLCLMFPAGMMRMKSNTSIGLYVHVPFCMRKCRYCSFYSEPVGSFDTQHVVSAMKTELARYELTEETDTVYVGGGSPSCLPRSELFGLLDDIANSCGDLEEFTVEVNPGQVDGDFLCGLRQRGVDRLSIGGQSFVDEELAFLGRGHTADDIFRAFESGRKAGFSNISIDLIFAIPQSTVESFEYSLDKVIALGCEHVSAYSLSIEPETALGRACAQGEAIKIDEETDRAMYEMAIDKLSQAKIVQYEISNFAKVGFECKHNLKYWSHDPYIGIGPAGASYFKGERYGNIANIGKYCELIKNGECVIIDRHRCQGVDAACETAVLNLRRRKGICLAEFTERTGYDAMELFPVTIERYVSTGLMEVSDEDGGQICLSQKAIAIADGILCDFSSV